MGSSFAKRPSANDQEDGGRQDRDERIHQADGRAYHAEAAPEQEPERDTEQQSSGDSMIWRRSVQGGNRCSGAAVCQMRSGLSADMGKAP